jgi:hypothetical protein
MCSATQHCAVPAAKFSARGVGMLQGDQFPPPHPLRSPALPLPRGCPVSTSGSGVRSDRRASVINATANDVLASGRWGDTTTTAASGICAHPPCAFSRPARGPIAPLSLDLQRNFRPRPPCSPNRPAPARNPAAAPSHQPTPPPCGSAASDRLAGARRCGSRCSSSDHRRGPPRALEPRSGAAPLAAATLRTRDGQIVEPAGSVTSPEQQPNTPKRRPPSHSATALTLSVAAR